MVPTVVRCSLIRESFVETDVILAHAIDAICHPDHQRAAEVADERGDRDVHDVITKAPPIRPATRYDTAAEARLNRARKRITTKDAQA
jgi:hypothetical protein